MDFSFQTPGEKEHRLQNQQIMSVPHHHDHQHNEEPVPDVDIERIPDHYEMTDTATQTKNGEVNSNMGNMNYGFQQY